MGFVFGLQHPASLPRFSTETLPTASRHPFEVQSNVLCACTTRGKILSVVNRIARDVIVVGAGLAGLAAARALVQAGFSVLVLDKSRGVSGRAASKRLENGAVLDYGAPCFTVRNEALRQYVQTLERRGVAQVWQYGGHLWRDGVIESSPDGYPRYALPNGISSLGKHLRDEIPSLEIEQSALVSAVWSNNFGYRVVLENGDIHTARAVLVNTPAPQALSLTKNILENQTFHALERVKFAPCWALLVGLDSAPDVPWRGLKLHHPIFSWASLEHTKDRQAAALVLHANPEWSAANLEQSSQNIAPMLLQAAQSLFGDWVLPNQVLAHRWRYAQATSAHPAAFVAQDGLVFCGDWCAPQGNARIETAFESGLAAAKHLGRHLEQPLNQILEIQTVVN
jgi:renalase